MLHDSNRPLRLEFYPSLRPGRTVGTDKVYRNQSLSAALVHPRPGSVLFSDLSPDKEACPYRPCKTRVRNGLPRHEGYLHLQNRSLKILLHERSRIHDPRAPIFAQNEEVLIAGKQHVCFGGLGEGE
jgi:hypothetical protein